MQAALFLTQRLVTDKLTPLAVSEGVGDKDTHRSLSPRPMRSIFVCMLNGAWWFECVSLDAPHKHTRTHTTAAQPFSLEANRRKRMCLQVQLPRQTCRAGPALICCQLVLRAVCPARWRYKGVAPQQSGVRASMKTNNFHVSTLSDLNPLQQDCRCAKASRRPTAENYPKTHDTAFGYGLQK